MLFSDFDKFEITILSTHYEWQRWTLTLIILLHCFTCGVRSGLLQSQFLHYLLPLFDVFIFLAKYRKLICFLFNLVLVINQFSDPVLDLGEPD